MAEHIYLIYDNGLWRKKSILAEYNNGNEHVILFEDGTKIRETDDDEFRPEYPENVDVTISTRCDNGCAFCYMGCTPDGAFAFFDNPFLDNMFPGMEMAINLNFPIHPGLIPFLKKMKAQGVFVNATVNENHFVQNYSFVRELVDGELLHGIGVSYTGQTTELVKLVKSTPNAIVHTIAGLITPETVQRLGKNRLKVLILGYKQTGRGVSYIESNNTVQQNMEWLRDNLKDILNKFELISFDNLALEQLDVRRFVTDADWTERYQGGEGSVTLYIDLVHGTYARDSLIEESFSIGKKSLKEMFEDVKRKYNVV